MLAVTKCYGNKYRIMTCYTQNNYNSIFYHFNGIGIVKYICI